MGEEVKEPVAMTASTTSLSLTAAHTRREMRARRE